MIFRDRHNILGRIHANLRHPLSIDIESARALLHDSGIKLLSFLAPNQLTKTLTVFGWGGFFTVPSTP
jgi:hypothetical protein